MKLSFKALAGSLCLFAAAMMQAASAGPLVQGVYQIEASFKDSIGQLHAYGCMIVGNNGQSTVPSLFNWNTGTGPYCGLPTASRQALWAVYPVIANGVMRHVIKSKINGQCLIRNANGTAPQASLFLWQNNEDKIFCGLNTAQEFIANGQAAWDFSQLKAYSVYELGFGDGGIVYSGQVSLQPWNQPKAFLMFSPTPGSEPSVVPDQSLAMFAGTAPQWQFYFFSSVTAPVPVRDLAERLDRAGLTP